MSGYIRVSAKTVEDAVIEAAIQLGTTSDNIDYNVIEKETKGFLGIGAKKAVIEAKVKKTEEDFLNEVAAENKKEKIRKPEKPAVKAENIQPKKESKPAAEKPQTKTENVKPKETVQPKQENKPAAEKPQAKAENAKPKEAAQPKQENKPAAEKPQTKSENKPAKEKFQPKAEKVMPKETKSAAAEASDADYFEEDQPKVSRVPADPKEATRRAEEFLKSMFATMGMQIELKSQFEDDTLSIDIIGDDMGILIGKRGQTLDSIQYLVSLIVNKGKASYVRVKLDTENYRERRKATLENLAKNIAFKVKKTRRPVYLEPMNPYERRIIHSALQNDPYVTTHSEGEEPCRKVVVTLKKRDRGYYQRDRRNSAETEE